MHVLISEHRDGRFISRTMDWFNIHTVVGSSSRGATASVARDGAAAAGEELYLHHARWAARACACARAGVVAAARLAGVPILPLTFSTTRGRNARSWDRFLVAFPFGRGVFIWGAPIVVPDDANEEALERARREVETALNDMTDRSRPDMRARDNRADARGGTHRREQLSMGLALYRGATSVAAPALRLWLGHRQRQGKEDGRG